MQAAQHIPLANRSYPNFSEVWQVGGDSYTAVAVAKKTGTGSWVVYNIFRDHLGTITHLKNGSSIDEYSYDAWGRRRDKDNWSYTLSGEPSLFADRGFTGHEYLSDFNLYNMNGRLYDPVLGRFLSPDPYIADPSFTQSYNRYSYVLNNPMKYNDPTGELPFLAWLGIAWAGNYLMGVADNHINKGMSVKDAFRNTNFVAGVNFSPFDMSRSNNYGISHSRVDAFKSAKHEERLIRQLDDFVLSMRGYGSKLSSWFSDHIFFDMELRFDKGFQANIQVEALGASAGIGYENETEPIAQLNLGFENRFFSEIYSFTRPVYGYGGLVEPYRNSWDVSYLVGASKSYNSKPGLFSFGNVQSETIHWGAINISGMYDSAGSIIYSKYFWSLGFNFSAVVGVNFNINMGYKHIHK
ncbi:MAG: RHS repeat domain-containing protein [Bacteroidota bacterium]